MSVFSDSRTIIPVQMRLQHIHPHPLLRNYIDKMWVFESMGKAPDEDMKLVVPNGLIKWVIPFRNGVSGKIGNHELTSDENKMILIGLSDKPAVVDIKEDAPSGSIGIEFSPLGAYRFFHLPFGELRNRIFSFTDLLGKRACQIEEQIANAESLGDKLAMIQRFLLELLQGHAEDPVYDYCVSRIRAAGGLINVALLEKETGYSSRWLNMKFAGKLGVSPKNLASIMRFQQCYKSLLVDTSLIFHEKSFYSYYYDQSHFIKEFRRFTGLSPKGFDRLTNNFGRIFYRD